MFLTHCFSLVFLMVSSFSDRRDVRFPAQRGGDSLPHDLWRVSEADASRRRGTGLQRYEHAGDNRDHDPRDFLQFSVCSRSSYDQAAVLLNKVKHRKQSKKVSITLNQFQLRVLEGEGPVLLITKWKMPIWYFPIISMKLYYQTLLNIRELVTAVEWV